jgi:hypothetical protein
LDLVRLIFRFIFNKKCFLSPGIETILQRIQLNGVMVQLTQLGQDPPLPQNKG